MVYRGRSFNPEHAVGRASKLLDKLNRNALLTYAELVHLAEALGFRLDRTSGSHRIYRHPECRAKLNLQPDGKDAKRYQLDQLRAIIAQFDLKLD